MGTLGTIGQSEVHFLEVPQLSLAECQLALIHVNIFK